MNSRSCGILLPISSLPTPWGIGDFGPNAYAFVDFLHQTKQTYWQILPLSPTDTVYFNSPYLGLSAFALNPLFISPDQLVQDGWIENSLLLSDQKFSSHTVDYHNVTKIKQQLYDSLILSTEKPETQRAYQKYCVDNAYWLEDYVLFTVLKRHFKKTVWNTWPPEIRDREAGALNFFRTKFKQELDRERHIQYIAENQWFRLKNYCQKKNIRILGDLPIYVDFNSADVWSNPEIFKLDAQKKPTAIAGVPPDYFSACGQLWGNPVYDWEMLKQSRYQWWINRFKRALSLYDMVRIDHFRGLVAYWEVPIGETTAINGRWVPVPTKDFLDTVKNDIQPLSFLAEDLGIITPDVVALMKAYDLPGMKVLLFAFGGELAQNPYVPHNYTNTCFVYTGTHDNNTAKGWYEDEATDEEKTNISKYLGKEVSKDTIAWDLIHMAMISVADTVIVPMQDILNLGSESRTNTPSVAQNNWQWRLRSLNIAEKTKQRLSDLISLSGRSCQEDKHKKKDSSDSMKPEEQSEKKQIMQWPIRLKKNTYEDIKKSFLSNLEYLLAKDEYTYTVQDLFLSLAYTVRERLIENWILTQQYFHDQNVKRIYFLSMEYLPGRLLMDSILNLSIKDRCIKMCKDFGLDLEDIVDQEYDAGLGNGGLGRLAACFMDSMATLAYPAIGYGIRYEFGIFKQIIKDNKQHELPEEWLLDGNPWEIKRPEYRVRIQFYGTVKRADQDSTQVSEWIDTDDVFAVPFDTPVPGYKNLTVNTLRLWSAHATNEFNLDYFNKGDYVGACHEKLMSENISKVLYPHDGTLAGKELRLKQEYFFSSASLQDIIRRFQADNEDWDLFPEKAAIHLNETHPVLAIPELMRLFIDVHGIDWDHAWVLTQRTFSYTNHTLMPEALEKWPLAIIQHLLPRHMEIIYEINQQFLDEMAHLYPGNNEKIKQFSIIEEGPEKFVRMAYLGIIASHSVNGVAELHSKLLRENLMSNFFTIWPKKFNNKTNGITPRRWLLKANPLLSDLINETIGTGWTRDLYELKKLESFAEEKQFQQRWQDIKYQNKVRCAEMLEKWEQLRLDPATIFDVQVKRIHEYKRQLLNVLLCIAHYNDIRHGHGSNFIPRTVVFAGKAAPAYHMAKLIIELINSVSKVINRDPLTKDLLSVHFIPNYRVSLAELIIPASDISQQISTAGTEASGTGNMKFALNGAITIGTLDGANIEILEEVGAENICIFGLKADEVETLKKSGTYSPNVYYEKSKRLKETIDMISSGYFSPLDPKRFEPISASLLSGGDPFMICADFDDYYASQSKLLSMYQDTGNWTRMSILNVARMGKFSSDRTIREYAEKIWNVAPVPITE